MQPPRSQAGGGIHLRGRGRGMRGRERGRLGWLSPLPPEEAWPGGVRGEGRGRLGWLSPSPRRAS